MPQPSITKIYLKITCLKFHSNFPGANELRWCNRLLSVGFEPVWATNLWIHNPSLYCINQRDLHDSQAHSSKTGSPHLSHEHIISLFPTLVIGPGGHFKNAYELLNVRALKFSMVYKNCIFQWVGKIFWVEFQRCPYIERCVFYSQVKFKSS